jgi:uncharacterized membrane protein YidH (DUF202 family)
MALFGSATPADEESNTTKNKPKRTAERRPARVEPKSFFANERTYIQWLNTGMTLLAIASFMLLFSGGLEGTMSVGVVLICVAFIISAYAFYTYFRRLKLLQIRAGSGYMDHFMPLLVSVSLCISMIMLLVYFGREYAKQQQGPASSYPYTITTQDAAGGCNQHSTVGVKSISYSPSGMFNDVTRRLFLVPSIDKVTALSMDTNTTVQTVLTIPGAQLGGLTIATDNRIFAVGNGANSGEQPILYELAWGQIVANSTNTSSPIVDMQKMRLVNSWTLQTTTSSSSASAISGNVAYGVAFVPPNEFDALPPSLLVAGDNYDGTANTLADRGQVFVFDVPAPTLTPSMIWNGSSVSIIGAVAPPTNATTNTTDEDEDKEDNDNKPDKLDKTGALNANLINGGLEDSKIGDLYFFENILYILNDHARVIRAWSREGGTLLATTTLPRVGEGFDENWSGLALERPNATTSGSSSSNLRGGPGSPLLVHLSLASPPQIWTFNATQGSVNGSIVFPACASAF